MSEKILVVDDEKDLNLIINQKYRKQIRDDVYAFYFAHNGMEALSVLQEHPEISIVLTDINMPEMDGLTLLSHINKMNNPLIKTIIISAYDDMSNIRTAMNNGAVDFLTKPINLNDLTITIEKTVCQLEQIRNSISDHQQLFSIQQDLKIARKIQHSFLPTSNTIDMGTGRVSIYGSMHAAQHVGGDFYDFFSIDENRMGFVVGDVSGKGVAAAMVMGVTRILIRAAGKRGGSSSDCIYEVNNIICGDATESMFITLFYGILNLKTGEIDYTNAGHIPPFLLQQNGNVVSLPLTQNTVVGIFDQYDYKNNFLRLSNGETLLICTDGITESFNENNEIYGKERLMKKLANHVEDYPEKIVKTLLNDVVSFEENTCQADDVTLLAVRFCEH